MSWVIRRRSTGEVICELFYKGLVDRVDKEHYAAIPIEDYLGSMNTPEKRDADGKAWPK